VMFSRAPQGLDGGARGVVPFAKKERGFKLVDKPDSRARFAPGLERVQAGCSAAASRRRGVAI
jgi:hypothetical protein